MDQSLFPNRSGYVVLSYSKEEDRAVERSIRQLKADIERAIGCRCETESGGDGRADLYIVIGTIGKNQEIDSRIRQGRLKTDPILDENGVYRWEGYVIQELEGALYIAGADRRGTIYGVYELSRRIGVSPWHYFGDVPVRKRPFPISAGFYLADYPSVRYRGIFINDEEELEAWAKEHTADGTIGPELYEKIFELLLRLKANYIWPAMHVNYFNEDPRNGELADEMGIVVGTSHCDMLLRSNQNEWQPWRERKGYSDLSYDYSIEGENRERIREYWREGLEQNREYENTYTIGMRGIHDSGFVTSKIYENKELDEEGIRREKIKLMQKVFRDQREILRQVLGKEKAEDAVQTFVPYKEVLDLYDAGLEVPEDVTLIWVNDNFGHMRRYPDEKERERKGGHGLYFHNSYWAHSEMCYLFLNSIPLAQTGNELEKSYRKGIRKLWVLNAGALKPLEMDMEYFLRYGWEAGKEGAVTRDPERFVQEWTDYNFSGDIGSEAADLYGKYAQLTNVRKVEHLVSDAFSQEGYGDEAGRRLVRLKDLYDRGSRLWGSLPKEERDSFFQLFLMKIHASFWCNAEYYYADRSRLSYDRGFGAAADRYLEYSRVMMDGRRQMLYYYNYIMCGGKWSRILTPEAFPPPGIPLYPAGKPALAIEESPRMGVVTWDGVRIAEEGELTFYPGGSRKKWIEIGNLGGGELEYEIRGLEGSGVAVSSPRGKVTTEKRIYFTQVKEEEDRTGETILELCGINTGERKTLRIQKRNDLQKPEGFCGFVEADGGVAIIASQFSQGEKVEIVPGLGRMCGDAVMAVPENGAKAVLEYEFYIGSCGRTQVEIQRYVTLNSRGRIRMEVQMDGEPAVQLESSVTDEWRAGWKDSILDNGEKLCFVWNPQSGGRHTMTVTIPDEFVTLDRINIYTAPRKSNNLGLPSILENGGYDMVYPKDEPEINLPELQRQTAGFYRIRQEELPLPELVYAGKDFWKIDRLYAHNEAYPQTGRGKARDYERADGMGKDVRKVIAVESLTEKEGRLGIEAECVLAENETAWRTSDRGRISGWEHLQSETAGRTGLAMQAEPAGMLYEDPRDAPGLNYRLQIQNEGRYHVWLLMYVPGDRSDSLALAVDGDVRPREEQYSGGGQFTYGTSHIYYWNLIADIRLTAGEHTFTILPVKTGFRVDRIYLTMGDELPPGDREWDGEPR